MGLIFCGDGWEWGCTLWEWVRMNTNFCPLAALWTAILRLPHDHEWLTCVELTRTTVAPQQCCRYNRCITIHSERDSEWLGVGWAGASWGHPRRPNCERWDSAMVTESETATPLPCWRLRRSTALKQTQRPFVCHSVNRKRIHTAE